FEEALDAYRGTLIFASHDRRLINGLATRHWVVGSGKLIHVDGRLAEYEQLLASQGLDRSQSRVKQGTPAPTVRRSPKSPPAVTLERLEEQIAALESALTFLGTEITEAGQRGDLDAIRELGLRFADDQAELDRRLSEWSELATY